MAGQAGRLIALALAGVAAAPAAPVTALAGRYSAHFRNGLVDGSSFWSDDVVEIVPVDAGHAYVRAELNFFNGHLCSLAGVATAEHDTLVYHGLPDDLGDNGKPCALTLRHQGGLLAWDDAGGSCKAHCGARGGFGNGHLPWASRRPITYLARLKGSTDYRDALVEWRTGHAARP